MAKTQIRLTQLTGSFAAAGDGKSIVTTEPKSPLASINVSDLSGSLTHIASAIQRIHGKASGEAFDNDPGEFYHQVKVNSSNGIILGAGGNEFSITESSDDVLLTALVQDKDMVFRVNDNGATTEVFRLDGDVSALKINAGKQLQFGAGTRHIADNAGGDIVVTPSNDVVISSTTAKLEFGSAGSGEHITGDNTDLTIASGGKIIMTTGELDLTDAQKNITLLDNDGDALSFDAAGRADILKIDTSNGAEKVVAHALDVVNLLSAAGDLTVGGNLTVNGTTTTVNSTTVTIDDQFIFLADGAQVRNTPAGIVFASGSNQVARPDVSFARIANDLWALGSVASNSGSTASSVPSNFDIGFRAQKFEVGEPNLVIKQTGNDLHLEADENIRLDVGGGKTIEVRESGTEKGFIGINSNRLLISSSLDALDIMSAKNGIRLLDTHTGGGVKPLYISSFDNNAGAAAINFDSGAGGLIAANGGRTLALSANGGGYLELGIDDNTGGNYLQLSGSGVNSTLVVGGASSGFGKSGQAGVLTISGSVLQLDNGASNTEAQLQFKSNNANFARVQAPAALGASYTLTLPPNDGNAGQILETDGNGVLTFVNKGGSSAASKKVGTINSAAGIAANTAVAFSTGATFTETTSALNVSAVAAPDRINAIDVFVNGQLLQSGTSAPGSNVAGGDYVLVDVNAGSGFVASETDADLKFAFRLEQDDVVSVIVRG